MSVDESWNESPRPATPGSLAALGHPGLYCDAPPGLKRESPVLAPEGRRNKAPGEALRTWGERQSIHFPKQYTVPLVLPI